MIRSLVIKNAGPFRGEHRLDLRPLAYAITARYEADPGRSNWGGKSMLVELVDFALTGRLKKSRRYDADGWLTHGERDGFVGVELEDGTSIVRSRRRGKPTQIRFAREHKDGLFAVASQDETPPPGCASQDEAAAAMLKHLAFDADDFRNIAYFESKQMARLIHTEPEKREEIIAGWLGTRRAEDAEARTQALVTSRVRELVKLRARRTMLEALLAQLTELPDLDALAAQRDRAQKLVTAAQDAWRTSSAASRSFDDAVELVQVYEGLVDKGKQLAGEVAKLPDDLDTLADFAKTKLDEANAAYVAAQRETAARKKVSLGLFDGKCPVAPIDCPAKKKINDDRAGTQSAYQRAATQEQRALEELERVRSSARSTKLHADEARDKRRRLTELREQVTAKQAAYKAARKLLKTDPPSAVEAEDELTAARSALDVAVAAVANARAEHAQKKKLEDELRTLSETIEHEARQAAIATQARAVFRSTSRRVSERALGIIGASATKMLAGAGIDLGIDIRWEYEGKSIARSCDDCGSAFPASAKVKQCENCGAARGQNIVRRLEFLRSDQSDAADDLAGVSLQLAAGSWLLAARQSPWATAMLDEPLAACDKTNRRAIAMQLVKLLGSGTWRQALVISHSSDTVDAFPGRIEVVVARDGSRRICQS